MKELIPYINAFREGGPAEIIHNAVKYLFECKDNRVLVYQGKKPEIWTKAQRDHANWQAWRAGNRTYEELKAFVNLEL